SMACRGCGPTSACAGGQMSARASRPPLSVNVIWLDDTLAQAVAIEDAHAALVQSSDQTLILEHTQPLVQRFACSAHKPGQIRLCQPRSGGVSAGRRRYREAENGACQTRGHVQERDIFEQPRIPTKSLGQD